jgi:hypothetical protein
MDVNNLIVYLEKIVFSNPVISLVVVIVVFVIAYKKPKPVLKTLTMVVFGLAIFYVVLFIQDAMFSGVDSKGMIIEKQENY